ncbi:MAG: hypothetical protein GY832_31835 [Chloroflexi bacterium]|nr:hypothetical protein [Chloroflexota bacterium]
MGNAKLELTFTIEKDTKNARRYKEKNSDTGSTREPPDTQSHGALYRNTGRQIMLACPCAFSVLISTSYF